MPFPRLKTPDFLHRIAPPEDAPGAPHFFLLEHNDDLPAFLTPAHAHYIEIGGQKQLQPVLAQLRALRPDFSFSITSHSAYKFNITQGLSRHLRERFNLQKVKHMHLESCVQEALINAVVHGNLGIQNVFDTAETMRAHYHTIEARLVQEPFMSRRIRIDAWDEGKSFNMAFTDEGDLPHTLPDPAKGGNDGRGLFIIQSLADRLWIGEDKRTLYMNFNY